MRILFHYTHKQTLGHTTRSLSLATAFCHLKADVLILQGGLHQPFIHFPQKCKVMDIPQPFDTRESFQSHALPISSTERAKFILKTAADYRPDVMITEFFPFGRLAYAGELIPTLRFLKKKDVRLIASIGYPLIIDLKKRQDKNFAALQHAIFALYDKFLIHTPTKLENSYILQSIQDPALASEYEKIMKNLSKKTVYTGYVFPENVIAQTKPLPKIKKNDITIVVSRGGGTVYPKLITVAIEAQRLLDQQVRMVIACGPATTPEEKKLFKSCLVPRDKGRVFLVDQLSDLDDYLRTCHVSISLCGYNTSVQLMRYGTPSVIIPYQNTLAQNIVNKTTTNDQMARAQLLRERFGSIILDYETMTAASMAKAIQDQITRTRPKPAPASWFNGADVTARWVLGDTLN